MDSRNSAFQILLQSFRLVSSIAGVMYRRGIISGKSAETRND